MKSSLYNHIRILLISLFTLVSNGAAWGLEFDGVLVEGAYEQKIYVKSSVLSSNTSYSIDLWQYIDLICSELSRIDGKAITRQSITDDEGLYIRWNIENKSNEVQTNHNWSIGFDGDGNSWPYGNNNGIYYWFDGFDGWLNIEYTGDKQGEWPNKILTARVKLPNGKTYSDYNDYQIVCYITNEHDGCNGSSLSSEPNNLKIKFTVIFNETGEEPDEFLGTAKDGSNDFTRLHEYKGNINAYTFDFTTSEDYSTFTDKFSETKPKYIRWYVADATTGKMIENGADLLAMPVGFNPGIKTKHGYYWSGDDFSDDYIKNITLDVGAENALDDYSLVMIASTDLPTFDSEGNIEKEPDYDYKYTLSFKKSFFSADTEYDVRNRYVLYDESTRKATINFYNDELTSVLSYFNKNSNAELASNYYLRWALEDKDGNIITLSSNPFTDSAGGTYKYNSSTYYMSSLWANNDWQLTNGNLIVNVSLPEEIDYKTTKVTLVLTDNVDGAVAIKDAYNNVTSLELEPNDLKLKYEYQLLTNDEAAAMTIKPYESVIKEYKNLITLAETATETYIDFYNLYNTNDFKSEVFGITYNNPSQLYIRWYIVDKKDNVVSELADETTGSLTNSNMTSGGADGLIISNSTNPTIDKDHLNVTYTKGTNKYWGDYKVVCIITDDLNGMQKIGNSYISDPTTIKARIVYYFTDGQDRFSGVKKGTIDDVKKSYTLTAAELAKPVNLRVSELIGTDVINDNAVYFRWVVKDELGFIVDDDHVKMTMKDGVGTNLHETEYGYIWYSGYTDPAATFTNDMLDVEVTSVNGNNLTDYTYTCYISKDITNAVLDDGEFTREPDYDLKCEFTINQRFMFYHYKGVTGRDWVTVENNLLQGKYKNEYFDNGSYGETTDDIRQGTHEWTYEIYVERGEEVDLVLPLQRVHNGGDAWEPTGYFRWYDWNTDFMSSKIAPYGDASNNKLKEMFKQTIDDEKEISRGLFYWWNGNSIIATSNNMAAVKFKAPKKDESWTGDIIACDVSKYIDGLNADYTVLNHEPTLSTRYKFIIRPAEDIADEIKKSRERGSYLEDHGNITIGVDYANKKGTASLRLNLINHGLYYFYNSDGEIVKPNSIVWKLYDMDGNEYSGCLASNWKVNNDVFQDLTYNSSLVIGKNYRVVASASDGTNSMPIAQFNCQFIDNNPILKDELPYNRQVDYLDNHYSRVGVISFDIEEGSTLNTPTYPLDNMNPMPFKWQRSHYGYCYPQLYSYLDGNARQYLGLSPLHGDYTILKSMNLSGVSEDGNNDKYKKEWYQGEELQDLTHHYTNGSQSGYFLYVDASDEARPIANVEFEGEMCTGSTLILSAMVADMTETGKENPQLIFKLYGVDTDINGNEKSRKLIHSFATCSFSTVISEYEYNEWYQVYAKVTLQNNTGVENYQHFLVSIDNYCGGTNGADYAIDDIRIYMQNSKVEVLQDAVLCGEDNLSATFKINYETLMAMMPSSLMNDGNFTSLPVYYRICNEYGEVVNGICPDENTVIESDVVYVDKTFYTGDDADKKHHYQIDANGTKYFVLSKSGYKYKLDPGKKYYVSVAVPKLVGSNLVVDESTWGSPTSICSMYSEMFEPLKQNLKLLVSGSLVNKISVTCGESKTSSDFKITGALQIPDTSTGDMVSIQNPAACRFDWIIEEKTENFSSILNVAGIKEALSDYRNRNGSVDYTSVPTTTGIEETDLVTDKFTEEQRTLLNGYISSGKLFMLASADLTGYEYEVGKTYVITAIPLDARVTQTVNGETKSYDVCPEPMEVTVEARLDGPELNLGFSKVNYESAGLAYGADGLRVGLQQLKNMQQDVPLHLPIYKYKIGGETQNAYSLCLDELGLVVVDSNDPTWNGKGENTTNYCDGTYRIGVDKNQHTITHENQSLEVYMNLKFGKIDLSSEKPIITETNDDIDFHEGYWYKVKFQYVKESSELENNYSNRCFGETYLTIKVVPEYVTWDKGLAANSNWLNDDNWNRSVKKDLYKDDYVDNGEGVLAGQVVDGKPATFAYVPMKFTKVTILPNSNTPNPYLYNLEIDPHSRILKRTANGDNSAATPKIEYDMMVEVDDDATKTKVYECERFYGNTCKEIYFKPQAQLRWQHYLTYERAWVDMELETNQWYTLAAPLNDLVAGDMYVPTTGRQETEAFKPITFVEDYSGKEYNRVTYPIYQRSWDKAGSKVMTLGGGYNADIDYGTWGDIATTWSQWSHVYNDVDEKYEPGFGYSIRTHHETKSKKTLIRLPKDDTGYNYFDYAGNVSNLHKDGIHSADGEQYRLAADGVATGMLQLKVEENKTDANKYYLIGNPYMASLKMDLFFNGNQHLEKKYWVIVNGELKSASDETGLGVVGPTQSFFVKTVDGSPVSSITLSPLMTTSNLITTANVASSGQTNNAKIRMSATDLDGRKSNVTVVLNDKASNDFVDAEDVELLHDSNLENVPQLYTVAGNQTAMVNSMSGIDNLPIGVMTPKNETVALTVNTLYGINDVLYLYDAKNNVQTELAEGMELMMETNQHGRYFITTRAIAEKGNMTEAKVNCYSPSQNLLVVSTTAGDMIKEISIYDASGRMVKADASVDNISASYNLPQGIYIVKVMTDCSAGEIVNKTQVR